MLLLSAAASSLSLGYEYLSTADTRDGRLFTSRELGKRMLCETIDKVYWPNRPHFEVELKLDCFEFSYALIVVLGIGGFDC